MVWHARVVRSFPDVGRLQELEALLAVSMDSGARISQSVALVGPLVSDRYGIVKSMSED